MSWRAVISTFIGVGAFHPRQGSFIPMSIMDDETQRKRNETFTKERPGEVVHDLILTEPQLQLQISFQTGGLIPHRLLRPPATQCD